MANYFASYDLNGQYPTHKQMDDHLKKLGPCVHRVLETVWYLETNKTERELHNYMDSILSSNDRSLVISASSSTWQNLLVPDNAILECWERV